MFLLWNSWRMESLLQFLSITKTKIDFRIGTAIGYSSMRIATKLESTTIVTIERDVEKAELA